MQRVARTAVAGLVAAASALVLAACTADTVTVTPTPTTTPTSAAQSDSAGEPDGWSSMIGDYVGPVAVVSYDRDSLTVVTFGSSTCVPTATSLTAPTQTRLAVSFELVPDGSKGKNVCTADLAPHTWVFATPDGFEFAEGSRLTLTTLLGSTAGSQSTTVPIHAQNAAGQWQLN
jgi:hypothetical protein